MTVLVLTLVLALGAGIFAGFAFEDSPVMAVVVFIAGASSGFWLPAIGVPTDGSDRRDRAFDAVTAECGSRGVQFYDIQGQDRIVYACGSVLKTRSY